MSKQLKAVVIRTLSKEDQDGWLNKLKVYSGQPTASKAIIAGARASVALASEVEERGQSLADAEKDRARLMLRLGVLVRIRELQECIGDVEPIPASVIIDLVEDLEELNQLEND